MSAVLLPVRGDVPAFTMRVDLDEVEFVFAFRFNTRDGFWYFDLADAAGVPIVSGVKVVLGVPLLRNIADARRPAGDIVAIDATNENVEATTMAELGDRVLLTYVEAAA